MPSRNPAAVKFKWSCSATGRWTMPARGIAPAVRQAIYHRGRDAQASGQQWGDADLARMKALSDIGLELSIRRHYACRSAVV